PNIYPDRQHSIDHQPRDRLLMPTAGHGTDTARILIVDRDERAGRLLAHDLGAALAHPPTIAQAVSGRDAAAQLRSRPANVVLRGLLSLTDLAGELEEAVARLVKLSEGALVIAISDGTSISAAMAAMRAGAHDYLTRPLGGGALPARIREIAERH